MLSVYSFPQEPTHPPQSNERVRPVTAEDVNKAADPATAVLGGTFMAGFREGWISQKSMLTESDFRRWLISMPWPSILIAGLSLCARATSRQAAKLADE